MLREFLSPEDFKTGIVAYLKRYSYQNTVNTHLWESLSSVSVKYKRVETNICNKEGLGGETITI